MWLPTLLLGCGTVPRSPTTVTGLQVVAIGSDPAQPGPQQDLTLDVWVADGLGYGADVVVWMCSPIDGRCLEFDALPGSDGLPLQFVAEVGPADPVFRATVAWPLLADIALDYVEAGGGSVLDEDLGDGAPGLLVWALACVPGVCDVIRQVRADPIAGSPTWWDATDALSDPARILEGVPPGEASVAVKFVPVWRGPVFGTDATFTDPNLAPSLQLVSRTESPPTAWLSFFDPDGDDLSVQAFTTEGGLSLARPSPGEVRLAVLPSTAQVRRHPETLRWDGDGDLFVVVEDGRGGTAVWSSTAAQQGRCEPEITLPGGPAPGGLFEVGGYRTTVNPQIRGFPRGADVQAFVSTRDRSRAWSGFASLPYGYEYTTYGAPAPATLDPCQPIPLSIALFSYDPVDACALGGEPLDLRIVAADGQGLQTDLRVPVIAQAPTYGFCP